MFGESKVLGLIIEIWRSVIRDETERLGGRSVFLASRQPTGSSESQLSTQSLRIQ
jgi:hypothetical protein